MRDTDRPEPDQNLFDELLAMLSSLSTIGELQPLLPTLMSSVAMFPTFFETIRKSVSSISPEGHDAQKIKNSFPLSHEAIDAAAAKVIEAMFSDNQFSAWLSRGQVAISKLASSPEVLEAISRLGTTLLEISDRAIARIVNASLDGREHELLNTWRVVESLLQQTIAFVLEHIVTTSEKTDKDGENDVDRDL